VTPEYSLLIINNEITAGISDVPINNPNYLTTRIQFGNPFLSGGYLSGIWIESDLSLTIIQVKDFKFRNNLIHGFPVGLRISNFDHNIEINYNEEISPLFTDTRRYMREIMRNNINPVNNTIN